ncbi:MAG: ankyrin repeat domain-containing protein, partial [Kangiellaceae bacterium]|nr:ankyrin repeat domain-containing protein [Kangiellaceae bacterium]
MKSLNKLSKRFILFSLCVCSWFFGQLVLASELDNSILNSLKQDNLEEFQTLVQQNTVLTSGINEEPLIHLAVLNKAKKITRWLTKQSIDINQIDNKLHTALTHSLVINDLRTAKYLVKQGAQVNLAIEGHQLNQMGIDRQPLAALIFDKAPIKSIDWLIKRGATLSKESNNQNLYPLAISASHRALVDRFLDLDSPPFEQPYVGGNFDGLPLVILACFQTKQDIVIRALSQGLNPELTFNNLSLLNLCIVKDNLDVVKKLVESGAHLSTADVSKAAKADYKIYQFLSTWIEQRKALTVSALKALLEKNPTDLNAAIAAGFDVNTDFANSTYDCATCLNMYNLTEKYPQLNRDDTTPLMIATSSGDLSWVNHVIAAGATVSYQNKNQRNALSAALTLDTMDIANRLISLGSELTKYQVAALLVEKHYQLVSSYLEEHPEWLDHWINNHGYQIDKVIESLINSQQLVTLKQLIAIGFKFDQTSDYFYPINLAIHTGNLQVVSLIVENTENEKRYQYHNPLELSLALKKKSITKTLVQYGFEVPDYPSDAANAELLRLFTQTDSKLAELLCTRSGFNPYKLPEDQITYPILSRAISVCPNDFAQDSNSYHWLKRLLLKKDFKLAGKLTKLNVDVNTKPASYDPSLLSLIIKTGSIEALKFLVENGVSLIPTEQYQAYPVVTAINSNQPKMALYLAKQFKKMQGKKAIPTNLISEIISLQKSNVLKQLIGSRTKDTPVLKEACEKETSSLVFCRDNNLLSDVDQELEIRLTRAVKYQHMDTVTSLLSAGVSPNLVNIGVLDENQSLLMLAASSDSLSLVNLLLEKGANPNRLIGRNSALDSATWSDNSEIFKRLYQVSGKLLKDNRYSDRIVDSLAYRNNEPLIGWLMANNYPLSNHLLAGSAQWISPALFSQMIAYDNGNLWKQSNQYNALLNLTSSYSEFTVDGEQDDAILRKLNALVDAGASLTKPKESEYSSNDQNLLSESISQGSAPIVNWLLDKGLTLPDNFRDYGDTLLT